MLRYSNKEMDDVVYTVNTTPALIPVIPPSPRTNNLGLLPVVRNSPSVLSRPLTPTPPSLPPTPRSSGTLSLRMPNVALPRGTGSPPSDHISSQRDISGTKPGPPTRTGVSFANIPDTSASLQPDLSQRGIGALNQSSRVMSNINVGRPLTSPVNIGRTSDANATVTIPSTFSSTRSTHVSPVNIPSNDIVRLPASPVNITRSTSSSVPTLSDNNETNRARMIPPTLSTDTTSVQNINAIVSAQIAVSENTPQLPPPDPIISRDNMVPINIRPLSPRDSTEITLHGVPIDRSTITPIMPLETDSDDDTDGPNEITTNDARPSSLVDIMARPPMNIPSVSDTTTADTTDGTLRRNLEGPMVAAIPVNVPVETVIRPASPTTQITIPPASNAGPPISQRVPVSQEQIRPINISLQTSESSSTNSLIDPAPPTTSLQIVRPPVNPVQPPIASRIPLARGRTPVPVTQQPTPLQTTLQQQTPQRSVQPNTPSGIRQPVPVTHTQQVQPQQAQPQQVQQAQQHAQQQRAPQQAQQRAPQQVQQQVQQQAQQHAQQQLSQQRAPQQVQQQAQQQQVPQQAQRAPQQQVPQQQVPQQVHQQIQQQVRQSVPNQPAGLRQPIPIVHGAPTTATIQQNAQRQMTSTNVSQHIPPAVSSAQPVPMAQQTGIRRPVPVGARQQAQAVTGQPNSFATNTPTSVAQTPQTAPATPTTPVNVRVETSQASGPADNAFVGITGSKSTDSQALPETEPANATTMPVLPPPNTPDYSAMTPEEQAQHRANFRTRFGILRNAWPNYYIPNVPDDMPLEQVHAQYDIYVRHIHISQDVDQYKVYLVIMWLLIELFCTKIGLNIGGYTVTQLRSMNKYERLLIELGETNYKTSAVGGGGAQSNWPVEVRIFFMALVNAVTFIIIKMLANYIGEGMATTIVDSLSSYLSGTPPQPGQTLFGGPAQTTTAAQPTTQGPAPGGQPLPQMGGPFGGIDVASLLGNIGSMFIRGQGPTTTTNNVAPAAHPATSVSGPQTPTTPRFHPAYDE